MEVKSNTRMWEETILALVEAGKSIRNAMVRKRRFFLTK